MDKLVFVQDVFDKVSATGGESRCGLFLYLGVGFRKPRVAKVYSKSRRGEIFPVTINYAAVRIFFEETINRIDIIAYRKCMELMVAAITIILTFYN